MDLTIRVNRLLAEFANRSGLPALSLDADGVATLLFDEQLHVTLVLLGGRDRLVMEANVAGLDTLGTWTLFLSLAAPKP